MVQKTSCSLDNVETTHTRQLPSTYQKYLALKCPDEWAATERLYDHFDALELKRRGDRLRECRTISWFSRHVDTGDVRVVSNNCRLRWCPLCANARRFFLAAVVKKWVLAAERPKFITLTLKHSNADLSFQINHLYKSFLKFRKAKAVTDKLTGGIWFFQIKRGKDGETWHPHLHIIAAGLYVPQALLSDLWLKITLTSKIVDIRPVHQPDKAAEYVARYSARPSDLRDLNFESQVELATALHGRRICGTWGVASTLSLRPRRLDSPEKWRSVGRWNTIMNMRYTSEDARRILKAWQTGTPLATGYSLARTDQFLDGSMDVDLGPNGLDDCSLEKEYPP